MAYKNETVVISVPISIDINSKLYELALKHQAKSKTKYASIILSDIVLKEYKKGENKIGKRL